MKLKGIKKNIFLKKGNVRRLIYNNLNEAKTATELAKEINKHRSAVSRALLDMEKAGLVKCINQEDNKFRHYVKAG